MKTDNTLIEKQKALVKVSSKYLDYGPADISYQIICDDLLELSGAAYAVINLLVPDKSATKTVAISGLGKGIQNASSIFGFNLIGKEWAIDNFALAAMRTNQLVNQGDIEVASPHITKQIAQLLKTVFGIGSIYSVGVFKRDKVIGTLVLIMNKGKEMEYPELIEIFAQQIGSLLFRVEQEKMLNQEQSKLEAVSANSPDLLILVDLNGKVQFINKVLPGFDMKKIVGDDVLNYVFPDYRESYKTWLSETLRTEKVIIKEVKAVGQFGVEAFYKVTFSPIHEEGKVQAIYIIASDITEQKKAEFLLKEQHAQFLKHAEQVPGMIYQFLAHTDGRFTFPLASSNILELFEVTLQEASEDAGKVFSRIDKSQLKGLMASIAESMRTLQNWSYEAKVNLPSGKVKWLKGNSRPERLPDGSTLWHGYIEDISDSKSSEEKFRALTENSTDVIMRFDRHKKHLYVNKAVEAMTGMAASDFIGRTHDELNFPEHLVKIWDKAIQTVLDTKENHRIEFQLPNGIWVDWVLMPEFNFQGEVQSVSTSARDITDKKKIEAELKESRANLDLALMSAEMGVWSWDIKSNRRYFDQQVCRLLGINPDHFRGTPEDFFKAVHPDDYTMLKEKLQHTLKTNAPYAPEYRTVWPDGSIHYVCARGKLVTNKEGEPIKINGILWDITEQKQAEQALHDQQEKLKQLSLVAEKTTNGIVITNVQGEVLWANQSYLKMTEASLDQLLNQRPRDVFNRNDLSFLEQIEKVNATDYTLEFELTTLKGNKRWVRLNNTVVKDDHGDVEQQIEVLIDITDRKKYELEILEAKEQADAANKAKSEFLANMSHEIRTPMNAIIGFSEILSSRVDDPKSKSYLDHVSHAAKNLMKLIDDILDLSKIEAGKIEITPHEINLEEFVEELKNMFRLQQESKKIEFNIEMSPALPNPIRVDGIRLRQVLYNLLGNAFKFTEKGGVSFIVKPSEDRQNLIFEVTDTGIGIPDNQHEVIFEAFRQQDGQSTRKFGGTGLGLTISKRLVGLMNGTLTVKSTKDIGSTFTVTIPYHSVKKVNPSTGIKDEEASLAPAHRKNTTILIAEDNDINRLMLSEMIHSIDEHIQILEADNGLKAVELANEKIPDLIFMDLMMPVMDGFKANQKIKENENTKHIPIIAWTAAGLKDDEAKIKSEFQAMLRKPSTMKEIKEILEGFINQHTQ